MKESSLHQKWLLGLPHLGNQELVLPSKVRKGLVELIYLRPQLPIFLLERASAWLAYELVQLALLGVGPREELDCPAFANYIDHE